MTGTKRLKDGKHIKIGTVREKKGTGRDACEDCSPRV